MCRFMDDHLGRSLAVGVLIDLANSAKEPSCVFPRHEWTPLPAEKYGPFYWMEEELQPLPVFIEYLTAQHDDPAFAAALVRISIIYSHECCYGRWFHPFPW